jgi:hypothetical protein
MNDNEQKLTLNNHRIDTNQQLLELKKRFCLVFQSIRQERRCKKEREKGEK